MSFMNPTDRTAINTVRAVFSNLKVDPTEELTEAFANADKLAAEVGRITAPVNLPAAVTAAILEDRDPYADPEVQRAITGITIHGHHEMQNAVIGAGIEGIREACLVERDDIVSSWRPAFSKATSNLIDAHARIGDYPLDDTVSILAQGGDIADTWAAAKTADRTVTTILEAWTSLMTLIRVSPNPRYRALRMAALTLAQWRTLPAKLSPWSAVCAGLELSLPTLDEYRARIATIDQGIKAEQAAASQPVMNSSRVAVQEMFRQTERARMQQPQAS